jgi:hypothetical protein
MKSLANLAEEIQYNPQQRISRVRLNRTDSATHYVDSALWIRLLPNRFNNHHFTQSLMRILSLSLLWLLRLLRQKKSMVQQCHSVDLFIHTILRVIHSKLPLLVNNIGTISLFCLLPHGLTCFWTDSELIVVGLFRMRFFP